MTDIILGDRDSVYLSFFEMGVEGANKVMSFMEEMNKDDFSEETYIEHIELARRYIWVARCMSDLIK